MLTQHILGRLVFAILLSVSGYPTCSAQSVIPKNRIAALVAENLDPKVRSDVSSGSEKWMARYMRVAFNDAQPPVLVIPINVDAAKGALSTRPIKVITDNGDDISPDDAIGANCLALAFFHGLPTARKWDTKPSAVYMLYECFSGYTRVAKRATLLRNARVHAAGEAILLELETGGQLLVYWEKGRYRTKLVRMGD